MALLQGGGRSVTSSCRLNGRAYCAVPAPAGASSCNRRHAVRVAAQMRTNQPKVVGDIMTTGTLFSCSPDDTVDDVLECLIQNRITGLPVVDKTSGKVVGVVSDFDLLALDTLGRTNSNLFPATDETWKAWKDVKVMLAKTASRKVSDVMTKEPKCVKADTCLNDATSILITKKIRRLPVVDDEGKLVGVVSRGNIVKAALYARKAAETAAASN